MESYRARPLAVPPGPEDNEELAEDVGVGHFKRVLEERDGEMAGELERNEECQSSVGETRTRGGRGERPELDSLVATWPVCRRTDVPSVSPPAPPASSLPPLPPCAN